MDKLKPCPFCGGKGILQKWHTMENNICCEDCSASTEQSTVLESAIEYWNTRANDN